MLETIAYLKMYLFPVLVLQIVISQCQNRESGSEATRIGEGRGGQGRGENGARAGREWCPALEKRTEVAAHYCPTNSVHADSMPARSPK